MNVYGKVIAVTGAAGGIGTAIAKKLAENGAVVWLLDLKADACAQLAEECHTAGQTAYAAELDVTEEAGWKGTIDKIVLTCGRLDAVVNLAAINIRKPVEEMCKDEWMRMMEVNTGSVFLSCKFAIPVMRRQGGGSIINISSICGIIGHRFTPEAYTASKGAVTMLTKAIAARYAHDGIRCNSVHPCTVDTPFVAAVMKDPVKRQQRIDEVPLGRLATVDDVANAVLFLASEEASFINGEALTVDGGVTCC